jgi:3-oxoacyl-[acyl-carrier-protein] synthase III
MGEPNEQVDLAEALRLLAEAIRGNTVATRALHSELRAGREKAVRAKRVKAIGRARASQDVPVSDLAMAAAKRALARAGR